MDHRLVIKSYTGPDTSNYAPRIRHEQWEQHKSLLRHLHDEGCKRATMLEILRKQGFHPSPGQLNAKMTAWGFKVYSTQGDSSERGHVSPAQNSSHASIDTDMAETFEQELNISPTTSRRSVSSITLCEPERQISGQYGDHDLTLDEVIVLQVLALAGFYVPVKKRPDYGIRITNETVSNDDNYYNSVLSVADFLCAVHCFEQAFDLYLHVLEHFTKSESAAEVSLVRCLCQCAISATNDGQSSYVLHILRRAHAYCVEHTMTELVSCFASLMQDLCTKDINENDHMSNAHSDRLSEMSLLIATDANAKSVAYRKEWLQQQLLECDETCGTLAHLSEWCQDTLKFYRLENQAIVPFSSRGQTGEVYRMTLTAFEHDLQILVAALIIDYLNSPGPSMKNANVECKNHNCLFRSTLSPSTSLIVMAHLIYEPLRAQLQSTSNHYLESRARNLANTQSTSALQELKAFAAASSKDRCSAFVDLFVKHFNTTRAFRRFVSGTACAWDRTAAAKRFTQLMQNNHTGFLPHAGLPSARRAVLKTLVAPFPYDPSFTEHRPSVTSDSGSLGEFERLASQIGQNRVATGCLTPSDAMSIDTRSSWSFTKVTGFSNGFSSTRNSLSRTGGSDEMEEYRHFIKDNNYTQHALPSYPDTPTQHYAIPDKWRTRL